jgi:hypothetical protein
MTEEQRTSILSLKPYLDTVNRTGTLRMTDEDYNIMQNLHLQLRGQRFNGQCKTCIIQALKDLIRSC